MQGNLKRRLQLLSAATLFLGGSVVKAGPMLEYYTEGFFFYAGSATAIPPVAGSTSLSGSNKVVTPSDTYSIAEGAGFVGTLATPTALAGTALTSQYNSSSTLDITQPNTIGTAVLTFNFSGLIGPTTFGPTGVLTGETMGLFTMSTNDTADLHFSGMGFQLDIFQIDPTTGTTSLDAALDGNIQDDPTTGNGVNVKFSDANPNNDSAIVGAHPGALYTITGPVSSGVTTGSKITGTDNAGITTGSAPLLANVTVVDLPKTAPTEIVLLGGVIGFAAIRRRKTEPKLAT